MNVRPDFNLAWTASRKVYDPTNPRLKVANVIGGKVAFNIISVQEKLRWNNTCAVRMSYILNQSGMKIPKTGSKTVSGKLGDWYFYRVKDLIAFLIAQWENPDKKIINPQIGDAHIQNLKGIILFEVDGWNDATGHATLWDGTGVCYDHCYFNYPLAVHNTKALNFWELP